ncbi:MAG: adenylate/guanylate cyclase domain-containing protein [Deltaproteobacteria bacterium]|nr:adenylate/guanylate cyclase domain-containing protein [Deltaproteobacteria bacterium]
MFKKLFKLSGFKISSLITLLFAILFLWNYLGFSSESFLDLIDKKVIDFVVRARGNTLTNNQIAIAAIDTESVDRYGRWPWGRDIMAKLLHELQTHYEIKIIGYDSVFSEPDPNDVTTEKVIGKFNQKFKKELKVNRNVERQLNKISKGLDDEMKNDIKFGKELNKWDNTVLGYFFFPTMERLKHMTEKELADSASRIRNSEITIIQGANNLEYAPIYEVLAVESNIAALFPDRSLNGYFNVFPDPEDGTVRRVHLALKYQDKYYPSLDLQILRLYYGNPPIKMIVNEGGVEGFQLGEKTIITDNDSAVMINYQGGSFTFPHYSVYKIINHLVPKEALKDKIVLLGATEVGVFDLRTTPVGVDFPGVEVHANLIHNIINDDYFHRSDFVDFISLLCILVFGLVMGIVLPRLKALSGFIFTLVLISGYLAGNMITLNTSNTWASFAYVLGVIIFNWFGIVLYQYFGEEKDKRFIKGAFQQYLSPEVINRLVDDPSLLKLGGEKKELTAFFSDLQGFSSVSESLKPEELVDLLNEYLTAMTDIIMKYGGTVDKFEGDAIIAFFGAPLVQPDHAIKALYTSLEMQDKMIEMRKEWKAQGKHELQMRIGLNTGDMVVGNMGSAYRMDYTMMGDAVNLAARLEGVNKQYKTYTMISEFTYDQVKDQIEVRELDMIRVMGKDQPVRIYEALCKKGELPEEKEKAFKYFQKGLELYRKQDWKEAYKHFLQTSKTIENDGASEVFMERCKNFAKKPPGENWDGVYQMTSK